jgi:uncharacterized protein (DUF488 family)
MAKKETGKEFLKCIYHRDSGKYRENLKMSRAVYTIGHSNHSFEEFIRLLTLHSIELVCDVRSHPYSRRNPRYNRETLLRSLRISGIEYRYLGKELGGRPERTDSDPGYLMSYNEIARMPHFQDCLEQIREIMTSSRVALLCAERDPLFCHRAILISRHLRAPDVNILHILADGGTETQEDLERRMYAELGQTMEDMFADEKEIIEQVYERWEGQLKAGNKR